MIQAASATPLTADRTCAGVLNVAEIAQQRMRKCPYRALRRVKCRIHEGVLVLTGDVATYYMKQMAQTLMRSVDQVEQIDNRIVVHA